jgi:hypothetical protein
MIRGKLAHATEHRFAWFILALCYALPVAAVARPADDANVVLDQWSAAYSANAPDVVANRYWPDALLLGTVSPVISLGTGAIVK